MTRTFVHPPPVEPGDAVAILSPSSGLPALFPRPYELGLQRLRDDFELEPVEYPCTRVMNASPRDRARDVNAAFADPAIKAVIVSIGGDDQLKVLKHLDLDVLAANPKPFLGYSDNVNLLHVLWNLGIVGYHGGSVMVQWGRSGAMHPVSADSLRRALFTRGAVALAQPEQFSDFDMPWDDPTFGSEEPPMEPASPWVWEGSTGLVAGPSWGGCLEVVDFQLRTGRHVQPPEAYDGCVLLLETSEELPDARYVRRVLMAMGERDMLGRFRALLVGRARARSLDDPRDVDERARYREEQREAFLESMAEYNPDAVVVLDVDFGHTNPQLVIPHGGEVIVDPANRQITVTY